MAELVLDLYTIIAFVFLLVTALCLGVSVCPRVKDTGCSAPDSSRHTSQQGRVLLLCGHQGNCIPHTGLGTTLRQQQFRCDLEVMMEVIMDRCAREINVQWK